MPKLIQHTGCVLDVLPTLEAASVHMIATSPPFMGLRRYPIPDSHWPAVSYAPMAGLPDVEIPAWTGQLGLEPTPEAFTGHLVHVCRLLWRVLRDDGTMWLNLGSSFVGGNNTTKGGNADGLFSRPGMKKMGHRPNTQKATGIRPKNDLMIPHRVAFALQADGWIVRSCIVWAKGVSFCKTWSGSVMPGSQQDRPTTAYEMVFLLSKEERYYYDNEAVKERQIKGAAGSSYTNGKTGVHQQGRASEKDRLEDGKRTPRNVWAISPKGTKDKHYAGWPEALVAPMIKAGSSKRGVCPACLAPWERVVEKGQSMWEHRKERGEPMRHGTSDEGLKAQRSINGAELAAWKKQHPDKTLGWRPTCSCGDAEPIPATVLDPFGGRGTTAKVARKLGRSAVIIDASTEYRTLQDKNLAQQHLGL